MAENTYKSNHFKDKSPKGDQPAKERKALVNWSKLLGDKRLRLVAGFFLLLASLYLLLAFVAYLFSASVDQSVVEDWLGGSLKTAGAEVSNWLGLLGAVSAHYFIFKGIGLGAFLLPPLLFLISFRVLFGKQLYPLGNAFWLVAFLGLWLSTLLGQLLLGPFEGTSLDLVTGAVGYELALLLQSLLGVGNYLFLFLVLLAFVIFFFNITQLVLPKKLLEDQAADEDTAPTNTTETDSAEEAADEPTEEDLLDITVKHTDQAAAEEPEPEQAEVADAEKAEESIALDVEQAKEAVRAEESKERKNLLLEIIEGAEEEAAPAAKEEPEALEVDPGVEEKQAKKLENYDPKLDLGSYKYPTLDLLEDRSDQAAKVTQDELRENQRKIIHTLENFKIGVEKMKATIGPTVTLYEIVPTAGIKISKIKNLEDDIALSLAALGIRIIAPIPGKGTIGIEVPNNNRETVSMHQVVSTEKFTESKAALPIVLGKTISNETFVVDLAKMPHLLIAGATGQGKSVGINVILASLLYKKHPSQVKFVLVDPKKVELTLYNKLSRHFLASLPNDDEPIITDPKKVIYTLNSLCIEMDERYDLLKDAGVRNLKEYNTKFVERRLNPETGHRYLPYIVLVIDELADLMVTAGKEVETPIARLAQLARAIGIHLVVATQRPSVNVITGVIKANFPARLSFRVMSKVDSRTILDAGGADQLIGMGDMLLTQGSDLTRIQCAFVDTPEVEALCDYIANQRGYPTAYMLPEYQGDETSDLDVDLDERDKLFDDAARLVVQHQQGSTSLIQRKLKLGYNRAGRIIDQLEAAGIVGAFEGSKAREVLIQDLESLERLLDSLG